MEETHNNVFEVELTPQQGAGPEDDARKIVRMLIRKQFKGEIVGESTGQMLAVHTAVKGSAGYVAMEWVTGTLKCGKTGSFALQHSGSMEAGKGQALSVAVIPDSGTDDLKGLTGVMTINVVHGKHLYDFQYSFKD